MQSTGALVRDKRDAEPHELTGCWVELSLINLKQRIAVSTCETITCDSHQGATDIWGESGKVRHTLNNAGIHPPCIYKVSQQCWSCDTTLVQPPPVGCTQLVPGSCSMTADVPMHASPTRQAPARRVIQSPVDYTSIRSLS